MPGSSPAIALPLNAIAASAANLLVRYAWKSLMPRNALVPWGQGPLLCALLSYVRLMGLVSE
jgi:hypothetical protein